MSPQRVTTDTLVQVSRWSSLARTWMGKASALIVWAYEESPPTVKPALAWDAQRLLVEVIDDCVPLVALLDADEIDEVVRVVQELSRATERQQRLYRRRSLIARLRNVRGRSDAEAAAFLAKADALEGAE